jgi:uncharacterized protein (DUF2267 family)
MQYNEFVGQVQNQARLASQDEALKAIRATLSVLAQRLAGGEPHDLGASLPEEIGRFLQTESTQAERFDLDEFFRRVSEKEDVDLPDSVHHARVVMAVVQQAVPQGEIEDVRAQLPEEYNPLFDSGNTGEMT